MRVYKIVFKETFETAPEDEIFIREDDLLPFLQILKNNKYIIVSVKLPK